MRALLSSLVLMAAALALPGCASNGQMIARASVMETAQRVTADYARAWNANDMYSFGALFAEDARYVNLNGDFVRGRSAIVSVHGRNRSRYPEGVRMTARLEGARAITDDAIVSVMIVRFAGEASPPNGVEAARITLTLVRRGNAWLIAQAQASAPS
ncbi:MAG: SgcJ/EcaC family oxidoreductase [Hyphomonadaceae bacterium]